MTIVVVGCSSSKNTQPKQESISPCQQVSYKEDESNIARLYKMINGKYLQYGDDVSDTIQYTIWRVNDGLDSVVLYILPVETSENIGYWSLHYQYLTSLPDAPISLLFEHFEQVDNDTIRTVMYDPPKDFKLSLDSLLANRTSIFDEINFDSLRVSSTVGSSYVRKDSFLYESRVDDEIPEEWKGTWTAYFYTIELEPCKIDYKIIRANKESAQSKSIRFVKIDVFE